MITPGLLSVTFRQLQPAEIIALMEQAGLRAIEWGGDIHVPHGNIERAREIGKLTRDHGITVAAYGSYYRAAQSEVEGLSFSSVLDSATALGAPTIRVWAGSRGSAETDPTQRQQVIDDLRRISELARAKNIIVSCEYHANTLHDTAAATIASLKDVNHPNLRTYWQVGHGQPLETGVSEIKQLAPWLGHVHVFHWFPDHTKRHPLAAGRENWQAYLHALNSVPGDRFAMLEFVLDDKPESFLADAATLKEMLSQL